MQRHRGFARLIAVSDLANGNHEARRAQGLVMLGLAAALGCGSRTAPAPIAEPASAPAVRPPIPENEVRALWVVRQTLTHPDSVIAMVRRADRAGFNTLIVQIRGRGDAYYDARWEPRAESLDSLDFDPLELTIREAHSRGLQVHAWLNTQLVSNAVNLPSSPNHIIYTRPDLLAVPRQLARQLFDANPGDSIFVQALAQYARENSDRIEGIYTSPAAPEVKEHIYTIWMDIVERYDIDGMHFDYVRYAAPDYDYSAAALERFARWIEPHLDSAELSNLERLRLTDPLVYTDTFPELWDQFRRDQITELVERIYHGVKKRKPQVIISAAVFANADDAYEQRFQDWHRWLAEGIIDVACPMAYTEDTDTFRSLIQSAVETVGGDRIWAGIGAHKNPVEGAVEKIWAARELGTQGIILFSYDYASHTSRGRTATQSYLDRVGLEAFPHQ